jgi:hypothetical protein
MGRYSPLTQRLIEDGLGEPPEPPPVRVSALAAAWRRGMMHAVERVDLALAAKGPASRKLAAVRAALDDATELQRSHMPKTYEEAFAICAADLAAQRPGRA